MTYKNRVLLGILLFITFISSFSLSLSWFTSEDKSKNNYLHIGKLKKPQTSIQTQQSNYTAEIYSYSPTERNRFRFYSDWMDNVAYNIFQDRFNIDMPSKEVLHVNRVVRYNPKINYRNSVFIFHNNLDTKFDFFKYSVSLDVITNVSEDTYLYQDIASGLKYFKYNDKTKLFKASATHASCVLLDLSQFIEPLLANDSVSLRFNTLKGSFTLKVK